MTTGATPVVSIVICTRDHAAALAPTLASLAQVQIPGDLSTELIIADNGSSDNTAEIVEAARPLLRSLTDVRLVSEPRAGQCFARNAGVAAAEGQIILFTDDDLRFPTNWIDGMCRPILTGDTDAAVGGVRLAPHLERPWMETHHKMWLASTEGMDLAHPRLVGANFAFSRAVLSKVPAFDTELGPGQLGFGDDTLFGEQIVEAGYKIKPVMSVSVEHHFDADRLLRQSYLSAAAKHGASLAYHLYHWQHEDRPNPALSYRLHQIQLALRRVLRFAECRQAEGMPAWEMHFVQFTHFYKQWMIESKRPRLYTKRGLKKLAPSDSVASQTPT